MGRRVGKRKPNRDPRKAWAEEARKAYHRIYQHPADRADGGPCPACRLLNKDWTEYVTTVNGELAIDVAKMYREALGA